MPDRTLDSIDDEIAADRVCYLRAMWSNHGDEAEFWEFEVERLFRLRYLIEHSPFENGVTP